MSIIKKVKEEISEEMKEKNNDRGFLDIIAEKAVSRKLLVWMISSIFLWMGKITPDEWTAISIGYVGMEGFADLAAKWKGSKNDNQT